MTVAAVILSATTSGALRDVEGTPNVRRLVDVAWSGGAVPVVVAAPDPEGSLARALAGSVAVQAEPAPAETGPAGQIANAIDVALARVVETDAALVWPARLGWVDAETITSLIEAHGVDRSSVIRPAYHGSPGWPAVVPIEHLDALRGLPSDLMPDALLERLAALVSVRLVELGDPGVVHDLDTPRAELPPYDGPPEPAGGHVHEWGESLAAAASDVAPLEGPALAPYGQAVSADPDQPG